MGRGIEDITNSENDLEGTGSDYFRTSISPIIFPSSSREDGYDSPTREAETTQAIERSRVRPSRLWHSSTPKDPDNITLNNPDNINHVWREVQKNNPGEYVRTKEWVKGWSSTKNLPNQGIYFEGFQERRRAREKKVQDQDWEKWLEEDDGEEDEEDGDEGIEEQGDDTGGIAIP